MIALTPARITEVAAPMAVSQRPLLIWLAGKRLEGPVMPDSPALHLDVYVAPARSSVRNS